MDMEESGSAENGGKRDNTRVGERLLLLGKECRREAKNACVMECVRRASLEGGLQPCPRMRSCKGAARLMLSYSGYVHFLYHS